MISRLWRLVPCRQQARGLATVAMGSILEHTEYSAMRLELAQARVGTGRPLGPLALACSHIFDLDLRVSRHVLQLNALALTSPSGTGLPHEGVRVLKKQGLVKTGRFTLKSDGIIKDGFESLIGDSSVDGEALCVELFRSVRFPDRGFLLQRQLVGFYLLQRLPDGDHRLPVEVFNRLAVLRSAGNFTEEEDAAILAWVEEHGARKWAGLARRLGRTYTTAGTAISQRFALLRAREEGRGRGGYTTACLTAIVVQVLQQNPAALEEEHPAGIDWKRIGASINRSSVGVYRLYKDQVHPTLRCYKSGTLWQDVRPDLLRMVRAEGWSQVAEIDFQLLAGRPEFRGHTGGSLYRVYNTMQGRAAAKAQLEPKHVTVEQLDDWWQGSARRQTYKGKAERVQCIVAAYHQAMEDIGIKAEKEIS
jgi:hypothetical protein